MSDTLVMCAPHEVQVGDKCNGPDGSEWTVREVKLGTIGTTLTWVQGSGVKAISRSLRYQLGHVVAVYRPEQTKPEPKPRKPER